MRPKSRPPACHGCPADTYATGFVEPVGPRGSFNVVLVGQGPGEMEAIFSLPFYEHAPAGARLTKWLHRAGIPRSSVWIGNTVWCQLPKNRDPNPEEQHQCWRRHVRPWLERLQDKWKADHPGLAIGPHLVALGGSAAKWLLGLSQDEGFERWVGTTLEVELPDVTD